MRSTFFILLFIIYSVDLYSVSFRHLNMDDGLSARQVFKIEKDANGYIWFFTYLGVDRYDGNEIRHYKLTDGLKAKDYVLSGTRMQCDRQGTLWIMLKNGKLYSYNRFMDSFVEQADINSFFPEPVMLNDFLFDTQGGIWICSAIGIYHFDPATKQLTAAGLSGKIVNRIVQGDEKNFYAGTNTQLFHLQRDANATSFTSANRIVYPARSRVESLYLDRHQLFVGTFSDGAFRIDLSTKEVTSFSSIIPSVPIRPIVPAHDGTVLIGADGTGVYRLNTTDGSLVERYVSDEDDEGSLCSNTVSDVYVDDDNYIWISTYSNGISYLDPEYSEVQWVRHGNNNPNSLISNHINTLLEDSDKDIWYGTNNGVSYYHKASGKWKHFLNDQGHVSGASAVILTMCEDAQKNIWVGGYGIGTTCINKRTGEVRRMKLRRNSEDDGVSTQYIFSIRAVGDEVWVGGIEGDLTCYNVRTGAYSYYPLDCIGDIESGSNGQLLIAACNGLAILDKSTGKISQYQKFGNEPLQHPIRTLLQASSGDIWLATDGEGLIRFRTDTGEADHFTMADEIDSNSIGSLAEDEQGNIWFSTEKSLYCLNMRNKKIINMNDFLKVKWGYYNSAAAIRLHNGKLCWGTAKGAVTFMPMFDFEKEESARLIFTDLKLHYQSVRPDAEGSLLKAAINETASVNLQYAQNSFSIVFSSIRFRYPHTIRYEYKLENFNNNWIQTNSIGSIDYTNLSPGKYVFRIRAINKYTQKVVNERSLDIVIGPPFWASWKAIVIYSLLACALIYLLFQLGWNKINEYRAKEKVRTFIDIAHDIRTPITLIKAPLSELSTHEELSEQGRRSLAVVTKNAERLFSMVTQLLDLQKADVGLDKLTVAAHDIPIYIEEKINDFRIVAIQKDIALQVEIAPGFPKVWFDKSKMDKIMDNLLSNAFKYTEKGTVRVKVDYHKNKWSIEVGDTGIGIPAKEQKYLFKPFYRAQNAENGNEVGTGIGMLLIRRMVKIHQGKISFSSAEHAGTTFVLTFPQKPKASVMEKEEETASIVVPESTPIFTPTGKNLLLLAEDDDDMREYLVESLSKTYDVVCATDGGKALELARELNPDIIISDVIMPIMQGDEMCRILKSTLETSHIPIILLTALSERENVIQGLEAGANDYILKPFDFSILKVRIRNILQSRQHLRDTVLSADAEIVEEDYVSQLDKDFLNKIMRIMDEQLANPEFSVDDFCRDLGMSRSSTYSKLKTLTGQSPVDFIRIIRLNKAKELLKSKEFTIGDVSSMTGFSDPKYFSTCFKKQFGVSPSKL